MVPKVFISYSWDSEEHKAWVLDLAVKLREDAVESILDQWHSIPGDNLPDFMEKHIRESDYVLIICTPNYKVKSDNRSGGVGYEGNVITGEVFRSNNHRKFIPILKEGTWQEAAPGWGLAKNYIDFSSGAKFNKNYSYLVDTIKGQLPEAPPINNKKVTGPGKKAASTVNKKKSSPFVEKLFEVYKEQIPPLREIEIFYGSHDILENIAQHYIMSIKVVSRFHFKNEPITSEIIQAVAVLIEEAALVDSNNIKHNDFDDVYYIGEQYTGIFLSTLIDISGIKHVNLTLRYGELIGYLGMIRQDRSITINGNLGMAAGFAMLGGTLTINGSVEKICGIHSDSGSIFINGTYKGKKEDKALYFIKRSQGAKPGATIHHEDSSFFTY